MKNIVILGAGRGQIKLYKAAKEIGLKTIAITKNDIYSDCMNYIDEIIYDDISDKASVLRKLKEKKIKYNGVITACMDTGIQTLALISKEFNLLGISEKSALICSNKYIFKEVISKYNIKTSKYKKITDKKSLEEAIDELGFPIVLKAVDMQGSNGVYICNNKIEALNSFKNLRKLNKAYFIAEEYLEGIEFGAQALIYKGEIKFIMPHGDFLFFNGKTNMPVGHYVPLKISNNILNQINDIVKKSIECIGLDNCAINIDFILKEDDIYIIEMTGRAGANGLCELVGYYYDIDYYKLIILMSIGENIDTVFKNQNNNNIIASKMVLLENKIGKIKKINNNICNNNVKEIDFFIKEGSFVNSYKNINKYIAQIILSTKNNLIDCKKELDEIINSIEIKI